MPKKRHHLEGEKGVACGYDDAIFRRMKKFNNGFFFEKIDICCANV